MITQAVQFNVVGFMRQKDLVKCKVTAGSLHPGNAIGEPNLGPPNAELLSDMIPQLDPSRSDIFIALRTGHGAISAQITTNAAMRYKRW